MTKRRKRITRIVIGLVIATMGVLVVRFVYEVFNVAPNAYAVWGTANLVIVHLEKNHGAWPRSWEELRQTGEKYYEQYFDDARLQEIADNPPRTDVENLQRRVDIDWSADPTQLLKAVRKENGPPFRVIWLRNGHSTHYAGREPNEMILGYLESKRDATVKP